MKKLLLLLLLSLGLSLSSYAGGYVCTSPSYFDDGTTINVYEKTSNGYLDIERGEMFNVRENEHLISMSYNTLNEDYGAGISAVIINKDEMKFIKSVTVFLVPLNPSVPSIYETQHTSGECVYVN
jgi:hypothetical protein